MKSIDDIERLLEATPVPSLVEGQHRQQLKEQLLMEPLTLQQEEETMGSSMLERLSPAVKIAAGILVAALLVGVGWAAEKIIEKLKFTQATVILEELPPEKRTGPDGNRMMVWSGAVVTGVGADDPQAIDTARRRYEELKELVGQKKYELIKTYEDASTGGTQYLYSFTLSDGTQESLNFSMPLDDVTSWDDYQRKEQEQSEHYQEQINQAIAAGRFRMIDQDVALLHICKEMASQQKFRVLRISLRDGKDRAHYQAVEATTKEQRTIKPESSWREHLQALREGKLELLDVETFPNYTYEVICDDGAKRIYSYGGGEPLNREKSE